jgi:hypothetical protein
MMRYNVRAGDGTRTRDLQLGKLTLYQLSYSRNTKAPTPAAPYPEPQKGIEPLTARLRIECSTTELLWQFPDEAHTHNPHSRHMP